jgi:hypothetical protein
VLGQKTEHEYFQLFCSDDLIGVIVTATNLYAAKEVQKVTPLTKYSLWHLWEDVLSEGIFWCNTEHGSEFEGAVS